MKYERKIKPLASAAFKILQHFHWSKSNGIMTVSYTHLDVYKRQPYHCILNPTELIWNQLKEYVARHNTTYINAA